MYLLFRSAQVGGKPNTLLGHDLLGVPLGAHWLSGAGPASLHGAVFLGVFALLAGLCWLSSRLGQLMTAQATADAPGGSGVSGAKGAGGSGALVKVLPYLTVVIAAFAPLAAGVYLITSLAWSLAERRFFWRSAAAENPENPENPKNPEAAESQKGPKVLEGQNAQKGRSGQ